MQQGALCFAPSLLRRDEFLCSPGTFAYVDVAQQSRTLSLPPGSLAFSVCQTPVIYLRGDNAKVEVKLQSGQSMTVLGDRLDLATSRSIFDRTGRVELVQVTVET